MWRGSQTKSVIANVFRALFLDPGHVERGKGVDRKNCPRVNCVGAARGGSLKASVDC